MNGLFIRRSSTLWCASTQLMILVVGGANPTPGPFQIHCHVIEMVIEMVALLEFELSVTKCNFYDMLKLNL